MPAASAPPFFTLMARRLMRARRAPAARHDARAARALRAILARAVTLLLIFCRLLLITLRDADADAIIDFHACRSRFAELMLPYCFFFFF